MMMNTELYYVTKLKESLSLRQKANPHYSMRAYARDINVHSATLCQVLKGKRGLPIRRAQEVAKNLELSPKEYTLFMESFLKKKTKLDNIVLPQENPSYLLDESYFKAIAEWEHFAVLELFELAEYDLSSNGIASKLGITPNRAEVVLMNLLQCGLLKDENGEYVRAHPDLRTTEDVTSTALKKSHKETMEIGIKKLDEIDVNRRDYSSTTFAIDMEKIPEAKTIIREFRQKMDKLLESGNKTEVYQLAIQFFPLSQLDQEYIQ